MSSLKNAIKDYRELVDKLDTQISDSLILAVLIARDKVQIALSKEIESSSEDDKVSSDTSLGSLMLELSQLDEALKTSATIKGWTSKVDDWRDSRCSAEQFWWWHSSSLNQSQSSQFSLTLNLVNFVLLIPIVGSIITTSGRLLALDPSWIGNSTIVLQGFLGFLASKNALTMSNQWLDQAVILLKRPKRQKPAVKLIFTILIGGLTFAVSRIVLPIFSEELTKKGEENYQQGLHSIARTNLESAIELDPHNKEAMHLLGEVYEVMSDTDRSLWEQARSYYTRAMNNEMASGYNSLGRFLILDGKDEEDNLTKRKFYQQASLTLSRIPDESHCLKKDDADSNDESKSDTAPVNLDLYNNCTNLGWAYLELHKIKDPGQNPEAHEQTLSRSQAFLDQAIEIWESNFPDLENSEEDEALQEIADQMYAQKQVTAYCLRAEVFDRFTDQQIEESQAEKDYQDAAQQDWNACYTVLEQDRNSYEVEWFEQAQIKN